MSFYKPTENSMKVISSLVMIGLAGVASAQSNNTAEGANAFNHNTYGSDDSAFGASAMFYNTEGYYNSAFGLQALNNNSTSHYNTAVGALAAYNTIYGQNTAIGMEALYGNQTGQNNIAIGYFAGGVPAAGNYNIHIGNNGLAKDTGVIRIGTQGVQKFTQIAGIRSTIIKGGQAVVVSSTGQLGVAKTTVVPNVDPVSAADIQSLRAELAATKNMIYKLQSQVSAMSKR